MNSYVRASKTATNIRFRDYQAFNIFRLFVVQNIGELNGETNTYKKFIPFTRSVRFTLRG